ncbi:hypothetical protein CHS0354_015179 [Potamilus streckersoni]|uniref:Uncharacterized protein n=1 Tax=Potamilus streckersoni TaxID=2493646 RepID=A0AAE0SDW2_9BIVA|nr:hypothetical protein CHS0354_015179 [Potamilus streckersoni]
MPSAAVSTMELDGYDNPTFSDRDRKEVGLGDISKPVEQPQPICEITFGNRKKDFSPAPDMAFEDKIKLGFLIGFPTIFFILAIILTAAYN